jgi:hypothetical protein
MVHSEVNWMSFNVIGGESVFRAALLSDEYLMKRISIVVILLAAFVFGPLVDSCRQVSVLPARTMAVEFVGTSMFAINKDFPEPPRRVALLRRLQRERRSMPERTWSDNRIVDFGIRREIRIGIG